ncbi:hypothetical protein [Myceligenerans salitolerans]|uniref:Uncharacterized protein n=1 Tax=Myceligenerans salitolerans TaxID=1230528 RepID=A0ABS3IEH5_9MICO|nr:hypothetical protein [Myceligenerans salitolerans]MBO0610784.1 hypothetical protein [Myceligenerans salitolerans]
MNAFIEWSALAQVLVAGILVGAGIPALFALGLRLLAGATPHRAEAGATRAPGDIAQASGAVPRPGPARLASAVACLAVVVGAVVTGLVVVVSGGH